MSNNADFREAIGDLNPKMGVKNDGQFNENLNKESHELSYTRILNAYTRDLEKTLKRKRLYKSMVFWLSYTLLLGVSVLLVVMLFTKNPNSIIEWCAVVIPVIMSFLTIFIVIPQIITQYLFNAEEEKYMSEVIQNIQNYDKDKST